jgi:hypothetical protein
MQVNVSNCSSEIDTKANRASNTKSIRKIETIFSCRESTRRQNEVNDEEEEKGSGNHRATISESAEEGQRVILDEVIELTGYGRRYTCPALRSHGKKVLISEKILAIS